MKKHIPNTLTLLNLFCGCSALVALFNAQNGYVFWFIGIGLIADVLDGAAARVLKVSSPMGKELDSLADMVSFGVLPAAIMYTLLGQPTSGPMTAPGFSLQHLPAFLITLFAGLRLAKFNLDNRQSAVFLGLPTPSTAMFATGLLWVRHYEHAQLQPIFIQEPFLWGSIFLLSFLMIAEVPMFSLKIKSFSWRGNEMKIVLAIFIILLVAVFGTAALSLIILMYIVLNLIPFLVKSVQNK